MSTTVKELPIAQLKAAKDNPVLAVHEGLTKLATKLGLRATKPRRS